MYVSNVNKVISSEHKENQLQMCRSLYESEIKIDVNAIELIGYEVIKFTDLKVLGSFAHLPLSFLYWIPCNLGVRIIFIKLKTAIKVA